MPKAAPYRLRGTAALGSGSFGLYSLSLDSPGDSAYPCFSRKLSLLPILTARILMALPVFVFVFLLVVGLLLSLSLLWRRDWFHRRPFLLTRKGQAQHAPPCAQAPLPRRLSRLSTRLSCLIGCRASACSCASLARGEKPPGSPQTHRHRGVRLSQPSVRVLRQYRRFLPCPRRRWQTWACRADPNVSLPGLPHHVQCSTPHLVVPAENPVSPGRHSARCAGRRA